MKTQDLTLEMFKDYIKENVTTYINLMQKDEYYKNLFEIDEIETVFDFKLRTDLNKRVSRNITFSLYIATDEIEELCQYWTEKLFEDFIDKMDLQDLDKPIIRLGYYLCYDKPFELDLTLYIK